MKFKIKDMDIATGGTLIVLINKSDAAKYDLHAMDRVKLTKGRYSETALIDIGESEKAVPPGIIGLFEEVMHSLKAKSKETVHMRLARKPLSVQFIKKKLDGKTLNKNEIDQIVWDIVHNKLNDVELTYFVSACYTNVVTLKETVLLTKAMAECGDMLKINDYPVMDKHCIGGVAGNRTTMILVPIIAAAGLKIPKTSSRSITSPAGTADTMEVLTNVSIPIKKMKSLIEEINGCMVWGGALNLAPSDDKIIKVERPLAIDAESQLLASIMAKKHSVSSTHILIDIPIGKGAKIESREEALNLKERFEQIGQALKKHIKVIITDGSQPIGNGIGPALEARDVLWILKGDQNQPQDLKQKSVLMAGYMLELAGKSKPGFGYKSALGILESGAAYKKMKEIIKKQGGKNNIKPEDIKLGRYTYKHKASKAGRVAQIDNRIISRIARVAGAPKDKEAGIYLFKHKKHKVKKGEILFTLYAESKEKLRNAIAGLKTQDPYIIK
ncbi:MAG: AMP phosphorylase [Nanoarchaeota archaeon]|nr:AMP phosphorylase [Nanoarchaeota archaeon]